MSSRISLLGCSGDLVTRFSTWPDGACNGLFWGLVGDPDWTYSAKRSSNRTPVAGIVSFSQAMFMFNSNSAQTVNTRVAVCGPFRLGCRAARGPGLVYYSRSQEVGTKQELAQFNHPTSTFDVFWSLLYWPRLCRHFSTQTPIWTRARARHAAASGSSSCHAYTVRPS